jgi:hypothetical protein
VSSKNLQDFLERQLKHIQADRILETYGGGKGDKPRPAVPDGYISGGSSTEVFKQSTRGKAQYLEGQLFVLVKKDFDKESNEILKYLGVDKHKNAGKAQRELYRTTLKHLINIERSSLSKIGKERRDALNATRRSPSFINKFSGTYRAIIINTYQQLKDSKKPSGTFGKILTKVITDNFPEIGDPGAVFGGNLKNKDGRFIGYQLGHGDYGQAVSGMRAQNIRDNATEDSLLSKEDKAKVLAIFQEADLKEVSSKFDHEVMFDENGKFRKDYVLILSMQAAEENQKDAKDKEKNVVKSIEKHLGTLVEDPNSTPLVEMIRQSILASFSKSKHVQHKGKVKERFREKSKARDKRKMRTQRGTNERIIVGGTMFDQIRKKDVVRKKRTTNKKDNRSLLTYLTEINKRLPKKIEENMGPPALESRTGRFANSVRAVDVNKTAQGHPSIGYTYDKNPYQVFEQGRGQKPWASPERDPRTLIDRSLREIAVELALGRFYTRRL